MSERISIRQPRTLKRPSKFTAKMCSMGCGWVVMGDAVPTGDGNWKEKGVDALLVADLIYYDSAKNLDHAILISSDGDFAPALKRVEDFGCRTCVVSICATTPSSLREASDRQIEITADWLLQENVAEQL